MARRKLRNTRPKALFGEAAAVLTAAGINATTQLTAADINSKATTSASKQQAQATVQAAQANAQALEEQNNNNNQLQQDSQSFTKEQNEESRQLQKDIQMNLQLLTGAESAKDRREESKIQVRNGGLAKGKRKLTQFFLRGNNMPFTVTDGGGVIPIGQTPEGFNLYEVIGNDHEHYHKAQGGKNKTGVGFKFADGSVVEGEGNQRSNQGEYLLTTPTDAAFISKHSIDGFNPVQAVNAGMNPLQAFALQEQIKATNGISDDGKNNASSPVKKNGGISAATNNILQPYIIGDIAMRRTLKNGGRPQAGIGDYIRSGLDWLLKENAVAQAVNNSWLGQQYDKFDRSITSAINSIPAAIQEIANGHSGLGWYGLGSTPTKEERDRASKAMENYYSELIKETKQDIKSGQFFRDLRNTNQLFSEIYGATGINLNSEYGLLGSATPGGNMAVAGAILRGGNPLTRRAMAEAIGAREAQAEMRNAMNTYGVRSGATTKFGVPATEVDPLAEQLVTDRAFANQYATTTNNVMANAMRKAQQKAATNAAQQRVAADRAFDKYLTDNPQVAADIRAANERARIFTPTVTVNGGRSIPGTLQFTDDLGLNAFGVPYPLNDYGARMMQIENGIRSQLAAMPTTSQLIGYMRNGAAQRSMMPRSLRTAGQRIGNALDNAYWWGRYLPARTAEKARNIRAARNAKASLNDPALDDWANGIMSSRRPAGQKATQATENAVQANWFRRHPYITTGLGITGLGIGGTLGYNLASYNPETDGPINMGDLESSYKVTDSMRRASRQQRAVTNAATNDSTSTSTPAASASVRTDSATTNSAPAVSAPTDSTSTKKTQTKSNKTVSDAQASSDATANGTDKKFKDFNEAFDYYHEKYGDDGTFVFGGLTYGTKKEKDAKKEARNRRWGTRRTEESLAKILGDTSGMSDAQLWDIYFNRKDRTQTRNGGYVARVPFTVGGIATDAATMNSYGINPNFDTDTITPTVTGVAYAANNGMLPTQINNDDENQARNGKRIHRRLKNGGRVKANNGWYQFAGAGVNSLGNIGSALISSYGNNRAARYLSDAYNQAGGILSNAYNSLTGIDMSTLRKEDYAAAHAMANIRSANVNVNPQLEAVNRDARQQMRAVNRNTLSSAARLNRLGRISDTRQQRLNEIYASQENQEEQIKQQNAKTITDVANENANRDTEANKAYQNAYLNLLQYNNDINNERILGSAGAQADALTNSAGAIAQARMSNANALAGAISSTGESFANAFTAVGKQNQDHANIMAGVDTGAKIGAALNHFSNADKEYLRNTYATLNPDSQIDAEYMRQIEKKMPELIGTNQGGNTPGTVRQSLRTTRPVSYFQFDPNVV